MRNAGPVKQLFQQNAFVNFVFLFVRVGDVESGAGQGFEVGDAQRKRSGDSAGDFELSGRFRRR
jgi:hypothetical protein